MKPIVLVGALFLPVLVVGVAACGDASGEPSSTPPEVRDAGVADGDPATPPSLSFGECPEPFTGECATMQLPRDYGDPDGETLEVFVTRFTNPENARGALWLLNGGPGGAVSYFNYVLESYREMFPDLTLYGLEHRGVGHSSRVRCSLQSCASQGEILQHYTVDNAARDLNEAIARSRREDEPVYLYGVSYGTFLAQRFLKLFPAGVAGAVLDSVMPADRYYLSNWNEGGTAAMRRWAEACDADVFCHAQFGEPAWPRIEAALRKVGTDHCAAAGLTRAKLAALRETLMFYNESAYALVPMAYRFERCNQDDVTFLQQFLQNVLTASDVAGPGLNVDERSNQSLYLNLACSELWEQPPPSVAEFERRFAESALPASFLTQMREFCLGWPTYRSEHNGTYPDTEVPLLILNGHLDSQTPLDLVSHVEDVYTRPHQSFVRVPTANHAVAIVFNDRLVSCGGELMQNFLRDPKAPLDTSCLQSLEPVSMRGATATNAYYFGFEDLWEGTPAPQPREFYAREAAASIARMEITRRWFGGARQGLSRTAP